MTQRKPPMKVMRVLPSGDPDAFAPERAAPAPEAWAPPEKPALRVWRLVGAAFGIYLRRPIWFVMAMFVPLMARAAIGTIWGLPTGFALDAWLNVVTLGTVLALTAGLTAEAAAKRPLGISAALAGLRRAAGAVMVLATTIAAIFALDSVFDGHGQGVANAAQMSLFLFVPAAALGSAPDQLLALIKGYFWRVFGMMLIMGAIIWAAMFTAALVAVLIAELTPSMTRTSPRFFLLVAAFWCVLLPPISIMPALLHLRLSAIKDEDAARLRAMFT